LYEQNNMLKINQVYTDQLNQDLNYHYS